MRYSVTVTCWVQPARITRWQTLRADYADSFTENGTHGSDSVESQREIAFFFAEGEVCPRTC